MGMGMGLRWVGMGRQSLFVSCMSASVKNAEPACHLTMTLTFCTTVHCRSNAVF